MYEVRVEKSFRAAHAVRLPSGAMESSHEHDWRITAILRGTDLGEDGFLVDFCLVQQELDRILDPLSGANLNQHPFLAGMPPSAEAVAQRIFEALATVDWGGSDLAGVVVVEAPGCSVMFSRPAGVTVSNVGKEKRR
jgi:6-pyruvoyltetrahydropterin/6-carboxytetrahydropterin synthase